MKKFAVFDIDGTLIRWQLYHAVADALAKRGYIDDKAYKTIREARAGWKRRSGQNSFKDYEHQVIQAYEKALETLSVKQFETAAAEVFKEHKDQVYIFTRDLVKQLKQEGYWLWAISGSQSEIVERITKYYGFDDFVGTTYGRKGDSFSGSKFLASANKSKVLDELIAKHSATKQGSIAVGDSESDIPMLKMVDRPIAFNPTKLLYDEAKKQKWEIIVERKNVIYKLKAKDGKYLLA